MSNIPKEYGHGTLWWLKSWTVKNAALGFSFIKDNLIGVDDAYRIVLMVDCILDTLNAEGENPSDHGMEAIWDMALGVYQEYVNDEDKTIVEDAYPQEWYNNHLRYKFDILR
jgi:hypothetical protein